MGRTQNILGNVYSFGNGTPDQWVPTEMPLCNMANWQTPFQNKMYC